MYRQRPELHLAPGFTLIELLVAVAIFSIVLGAVYVSFANTLTSKQRAETHAAVYRAGRLAVSRIAEELQSAYFPASTSTSAEPLFRSFQFGDRERPLDSVIFPTLSARPTGIPSHDSDQRMVTYFFPVEATSKWLEGPSGRVSQATALVEQSSRLLVSPQEANPLPPSDAAPLSLLRRESSPIGKDPMAAGLIVPFVDNVAWFRLRFHDGQKWIRRWDSGDSAVFAPLPRAVEVALALYDQEGAVHLFSTAVAIPMALAIPAKPVKEEK